MSTATHETARLVLTGVALAAGTVFIAGWVLAETAKAFVYGMKTRGTR